MPNNIWEILLIYFAPSIFALMGRKRNAPMIIMVNLALGWTVILWFICMGWAMTKEKGVEYKL